MQHTTVLNTFKIKKIKAVLLERANYSPLGIKENTYLELQYNHKWDYPVHRGGIDVAYDNPDKFPVELRCKVANYLSKRVSYKEN